VSTRRSLRWILLGIAVVAAGAAVRSAWRRAQRPAPTAPTSPTTVSPPAGRLTLEVDSTRRIEVVPGTPIVFDVFLSAPEGGPPAESVRPGGSWRALVRLVEASGRPLTWATVPREDASIPGRHLTLEASPETTGAVPPATYLVRAVLEGEPALASAPVTVVVRGPAADPDGEALEERRLRDAAAFDLEKKRFADARQLAESLARRVPRDAGAWMLLGDALDGLGKPREALNVYRRALSVRPRTYDEPTLLYERMAAMLRKIAS
jgi:hypothetical protein